MDIVIVVIIVLAAMGFLLVKLFKIGSVTNDGTEFYGGPSEWIYESYYWRLTYKSVFAYVFDPTMGYSFPDREWGSSGIKHNLKNKEVVPVREKMLEDAIQIRASLESQIGDHAPGSDVVKLVHRKLNALNHLESLVKSLKSKEEL